MYLIRLIGFAFLMFGILFSNAFAEKRIALVVGNNKYTNLSKDNQLLSAINDAEAVKDALELLGFEVLLGTDLNRDQFEDKVFEFADRIKAGDIALFFFAGHGVNLSGGNYFLPSDIRAPQSTRKSEEGRLIKKSIWEQEIFASMKAAGASVSISVIDACRNNPLTVTGGRSLGSTRGLQRNLATPQETKGTFSIYSAGYGQRALDRLPGESTGVNSVFTRVFVEKLTQPGMTLRKLAIGIKKDVSDMASNVGREQDPAYYDGIQGTDPYLSSTPPIEETVSPDNKTAKKNKVGKKLAEEYELAFWESVRSSKDPNAIRAYLKKFPNGEFAELAKVQITGLRSIRVEKNSAKKLAEWQKIANTNNVSRVQEYIDRNEDGPHIADAEQKLALLKKEKQEEIQLKDRAASDARIREDSLWNTFKNSNDISLLQVYLDSYPSGKYASEARAKINALTRVDQQPNIETQLWDAVKKLNSKAAFKAYLDQYPNGKYASLARVQMMLVTTREQPPVVNNNPPPQNNTNRPQYDGNGCRLPSGSYANQVKQVVEFYYNELDQGNANCAISRRINPSRKLKRLIRNFADAQVQYTQVTHQSDSYAEVLATGRVRGRGQNWENFRVSVALRQYNSVWRIAKIGYAR